MDYNEGMTGFTKLFSTIIHSTIWRQDMHIKVVWITMLAMADRNGRVWASVPGLADAARVTLEQCQDALKTLLSPDVWSRTKDNEGRRISEIDGGWQICNYGKYRAARDQDARRLQVREAVRRHRAVIKDVINVSHVSQGKPKQKQIADNTTPPISPSGGKFTKPTPQEVDDYIKTQGYSGFTGQQFVDHYEAKGWVIGKSPMKSWQAAVRTWSLRSRVGTPFSSTREKFGGDNAVKRDDRPCQYCGKPYPCKCYEGE